MVGTPSDLQCLAYAFQRGKTTVHEAIQEVMKAIWEVMGEQFLIGLPGTEERRRRLALTFFNNHGLPHCVAALDCTHVVMKRPSRQDHMFYFDRYENFSMTSQAFVDADLNILSVWSLLSVIVSFMWLFHSHMSNIACIRSRQCSRLVDVDQFRHLPPAP